MSAMILYKTGDPCPLCGQPIKTRHPADLYALSAIAHILGLNDVARTEQDGLAAEQLREKIKAMEAKLALATPEVAEFKAAFDRAQAELVTMLKALRKVQAEEVKTRLTQAAETMLGNFSRQIGG